MNIIRRFKKIGIAGLMMLALLVNGCGYLEDTEMHDYKEENEKPLFKDSEHQSLYQLFGDASANELRDLVQDILDNLQSANRNGDITREDAEFIKAFLQKTRDIVAGLQEKDSDVQDNLIDLINMAHKHKVGDLLTNILSALAVDGAESCMQNENPDDPDDQFKCNMLVENLLPMLEYIMDMDFGDFKGIPLAVPEAVQDVEITSQDISKLTAALGHIVNPEGPYANVYTQAQALYELAKEREVLLEKRPTVEDTKILIKKLIATFKWMLGKMEDLKENIDVDVNVDAESLFNTAKNAAMTIMDIYKTEGELSPESIEDVFIDMWYDLSPDTNIDVTAIADAVLAVWEEENAALIDDANNALYAVARFLGDDQRTGHDGWGWTNVKGMTDMERALLCFQDLLNPVIQSRESLNAFLLNTIKGANELDGADNIRGIIKGLSSVNINDMKEIDTALYKYMIQYNIEGDSRGTTDINMSVLRGVFYMLTSLYEVSTLDLVEGNVTNFLLNLIDTQEGTDNYPEIPKQNILEWMLDLMIAGMYEYPESYNYIPGYPDPLEGLDWVFYEQDFLPLGISINLPIYNNIFKSGLYGVLGILLEHDILLGAVNSLIGGLTDPLPSIIEFTGGTGERYSTGEKHKLFAIMAPLLKHYYDQGRILDLVKMVKHVNEIDPYEYVKLVGNGSDATFRRGTTTENRLGHVFENIEGRLGYGALYYGFRGDSDADDDHKGDPLDPILDVAVRVLKKLNTTPYNANGSLLDYMISFSDNVDYNGKTPEELIDSLFEPDESGKSIIDKVYNFLSENHNDIVVLTKGTGKVLEALHTDINNNADNGFDISDIFNILANGEVLDVLNKELLSNDETRETFHRFVRTIIDSSGVINDDDVIADDGEILLKGKEVKDFASKMLDICLRVVGGATDDFQVLVPYVEDIWNTFNSVIKNDTLTDDQKVTAIVNSVRPMLNSPDVKVAMQHTVRVILEEADSFGFTNEAFILKAQELVGTVLDNSDVLLDDVETILPNMLAQLMKVDIPTDADKIDIESVTNSFNKIIEVVIDEIGSDSILTDKVKIVIYKLLYVKDDKYNKDGVFTDNAKLIEIFESLLAGENRKYDLMPVINFLNEATEKDALAKFLSDDSRNESSLLRDVQEEDVEMIISMRLIRTVFRPYDGRPSIAEMLFKALHIHRIENGKLETLDVNLFLEDLANILYEMKVDPETNPRFYRVLLDLLNQAADITIL